MTPSYSYLGNEWDFRLNFLSKGTLSITENIISTEIEYRDKLDYSTRGNLIIYDFAGGSARFDDGFPYYRRPTTLPIGVVTYQGFHGLIAYNSIGDNNLRSGFGAFVMELDFQNEKGVLKANTSYFDTDNNNDLSVVVTSDNLSLNPRSGDIKGTLNIRGGLFKSTNLMEGELHGTGGDGFTGYYETQEILSSYVGMFVGTKE